MQFQFVSFAWYWGLIGSLFFTGILLIHHFFGPGPDIRDENGKRKKIPAEYRTFMIIEMLALVSIILGCATMAIVQLKSVNSEAGAIAQFAAGYSVLFIINLWDLVVIDWALVVRFRPKSIELPDTPYFNTMKPHVLGRLAGNLYMLPLAGIAYLIARII